MSAVGPAARDASESRKAESADSLCSSDCRVWSSRSGKRSATACACTSEKGSSADQVIPRNQHPVSTKVCRARTSVSFATSPALSYQLSLSFATYSSPHTLVTFAPKQHLQYLLSPAHAQCIQTPLRQPRVAHHHGCAVIPVRRAAQLGEAGAYSALHVCVWTNSCMAAGGRQIGNRGTIGHRHCPSGKAGCLRASRRRMAVAMHEGLCAQLCGDAAHHWLRAQQQLGDPPHRWRATLDRAAAEHRRLGPLRIIHRNASDASCCCHGC